ncbi:MAG: type II secretion system protein GspG [Parcubacteria group bacterium]|nr:type II secretion system protein GspG [Parcubacteria group bacterium]
MVISIIGFLATASMVMLNNVRMKARDARRVGDIKQIQTALELYYDANNSYPNIVQSADHINCENRFPTLDTYLGNYISVIPHDPLGPASRYCYYYNVKNSGQGYVIMAYQVELTETAAKGEGTNCYPDTTNVYCKGVNYR